MENEAPIFSVQNVELSFGGKPLFTGIDIFIKRGDKVCLIGRNGSGKSTLLKIIAGLIEPDKGEKFLQPGIKIAYMAQDSDFKDYNTLRDVVLSGLTDQSETFKADILLDNFEINGDLLVSKASGGEKKKAAMAKALVSEPDLLLLDEPTNHLDIWTIEKIEKLVKDFNGAVIVISHDKAFLNSVSNATIWIDRGKVYSMDKGFVEFEEWSENILEQQELEAIRLKKKIERETQWLHKGVTARRKRNMGRLRRLQDLRLERKEQIKSPQAIDIFVDSGNVASKLVIECKHLSKQYEDRKIIDDFSFRLMRKNKIGIVGTNGVGKTTLIKLLTGKIEPDSGSVRIMRNLQEAYFDQSRATLDLNKTIKETLCPDGGDTVFVGEEPRHVISYMKDFLFTPAQLDQPVLALSGGEKNRLILAKTLAKPSNLLVLDEPTNDLDMDTLDLLQETLMNYDGTVLIVSHDRDFLDNVATSILYLSGDGSVVEYVSSCSDVIKMIKEKELKAKEQKEKALKKETKKVEETPKQNSNRMSYKNKRLLEILPKEIEDLEEQINKIENVLNDPELYSKNPNQFTAWSEQLEQLKTQKDEKETLWLELSCMADE
ncbi:MAG: ABC-F family ATP-binding cassette domain-containing protein [Alphaproteobacteria bacterium]|nr:ABC-F family ATP-binding cassette domain-containing protein [Alphaproteobacteria bacterium]